MRTPPDPRRPHLFPAPAARSQMGSAHPARAAVDAPRVTRPPGRCARGRRPGTPAGYTADLQFTKVLVNYAHAYGTQPMGKCHRRMPRAIEMAWACNTPKKEHSRITCTHMHDMETSLTFCSAKSTYTYVSFFALRSWCIRLYIKPKASSCHVFMGFGRMFHGNVCLGGDVDLD